MKKPKHRKESAGQDNIKTAVPSNAKDGGEGETLKSQDTVMDRNSIAHAAEPDDGRGKGLNKPQAAERQERWVVGKLRKITVINFVQALKPRSIDEVLASVVCSA